MSKIESAVRVALDFNEAFNHQDISGMMKLVSDGCILESHRPAPDGAVYTGTAEITRFWQEFFRDAPNAQREIEDLFGLGKRCVMRWRYNWGDESMEKENVRGIDLYRVEIDTIDEILSYVKG